jgi:hypothetical protein
MTKMGDYPRGRVRERGCRDGGAKGRFDANNVPYAAADLLTMANMGAVRLNSILPVRAPGHGGAPLFLLMNCHSARQVLSPKMAHTHLP